VALIGWLWSRITLEGVSGVDVDEGDDGSPMVPTSVIGVAVDAAAIDADRQRAVRAALVYGENSGESTEFNFDEFLGRTRRPRFRYRPQG
jgi:hypothetical protein